jgi:hypothetical protein
MMLLSACTSGPPAGRMQSTTAVVRSPALGPAASPTGRAPGSREPSSSTRAPSVPTPTPTTKPVRKPGKPTTKPVAAPGRPTKKAVAKSATPAAHAQRPTAKPAGKPAVVTDPLTGGRLSANPVIAAKIDNTYFDVPQFGVASADVVFVEQVEGGLTRLIAVFHSSFPTDVGPVRSVRSTDAQLLPGFGTPALVFAGGAAGPMAALDATRVVDTTGIPGAYFRSDVAAGSYNLHADVGRIAQQATNLGRVRSIGFHFLANAPQVANGKPVSSIHVLMLSGATDFQYIGGRFVRFRHGEPVSDHGGEVQAAENVLVMGVVDQPDGTVDTLGSPSYLSKTVGSGQATLYRDGHAVPGYWKRGRSTDPFVFTDSAGRWLPFRPGKTWVLLAPQDAQVAAG